MPYPTPPVLVSFEPEQTPNLMAGGTYSDQLNKIMAYLEQLGAYIDDNLRAIDERFAGVEATIATIEQNHEAVVTALSGVTYDAEHALFAGLTATGGTVTSPALVEIKSQFAGVSGEIDTIQGQIQEDQASIAELGDELNTVSKWQANASSAITLTIPVSIDPKMRGVKTQEVQIMVFDSKGNYNADITQTLWNAMAQLYLAAPNDDQTQLLGYLGDNSDDDHTAAMSTLRPKSSAALTAAYESGGLGEDSVPENVVTYDLDTLYSEGRPIQRLTVGPLNLSPSSASLNTPNDTKLIIFAGSDTAPKLIINTLQDQNTTLELGKVWPALTSEQLGNAVQTDPTSGRGIVVAQLPA